MKQDLGEIAAIAHNRLGHYDQVRAYLAGRNIYDLDIDQWGIGYWDRPGTMLENRVILPIYGFSRDTVVAVSGRVLDDSRPKYWNTPFTKARWLYGLWLCRQKTQTVVLVESQMDAIALHSLGICALATMGSSLGGWQAALVRYFADRAIVWPHADKPEQGQAWVQTLREQGCRAVYAHNPYPEGAPADADADWMVQNAVGRLADTIIALEQALDGPGLADMVANRIV